MSSALRDLRRAAGLSLRRVPGVNKDVLSQYERGEGTITATRARALARAYKVAPSVVLEHAKLDRERRVAQQGGET